MPYVDWGFRNSTLLLAFWQSLTEQHAKLTTSIRKSVAQVGSDMLCALCSENAVLWDRYDLKAKY